MLPKDPVMLLSFINTHLRDQYASLDELAAANMVDKQEIIDKIRTIGYEYDAKLNQFKV